MGILLSDYIYQSGNGHVAYYCPGCESLHLLNIKPEVNPGPKWEYNGNHDKPSFHPSIDVRVGHFTKGQQTPVGCEECQEAVLEKRDTECVHCHCWVKDGMITFLTDCTHKLMGQVVPVPKLPEFLFHR